ncbi:hypothetical protein [Methanopyrus sp.]
MVGPRTAVAIAALLALIAPVNAHVYVLIDVSDHRIDVRSDWVKLFITAASMEREWMGGNIPSVVPIAVQGKPDKFTLNLLTNKLGSDDVVLTYRYRGEVPPGWKRLSDDLGKACIELVEEAMRHGVPVRFLLCLDGDQLIAGLELAPIVSKQQGAIVWRDLKPDNRVDLLDYIARFNIPVLTLEQYLENPEYDFSNLRVRALATVQPIVSQGSSSQPFDPIALAAVQFACMRPALLALVQVSGPVPDVGRLKLIVRNRFLRAYGRAPNLDDVEYVVAFGSILVGYPNADVGIACFPLHGVPGFLAVTKMLASMHLHGPASPVVVFDPTASLTAYCCDLQRSVEAKWITIPVSANLQHLMASAPCSIVFARVESPAKGTEEALNSILRTLNSEGESFLFVCADPDSVAKSVEAYATPEGYPKFRGVVAFPDPAGTIMAYLFAASGVELGRAVVWASWELDQLRRSGYLEGVQKVSYLFVGDPFYRFDGPLRYPLPYLREGKGAIIELPRAFLVPVDVYRFIPVILPGFVTGLTRIPEDPDSTVLAEGTDFVIKRLGPDRYAVTGILIDPAGIRRQYVLPLDESNKYHVTVVLKLVSSKSSPSPSSSPPRPVSGVPACGIAVTLASLLVVSGVTRARARSWRTSRSRTSPRS